MAFRSMGLQGPMALLPATIVDLRIPTSGLSFGIAASGANEDVPRYLRCFAEAVSSDYARVAWWLQQ
jgi:hypothetical protein